MYTYDFAGDLNTVQCAIMYVYMYVIIPLVHVHVSVGDDGNALTMDLIFNGLISDVRRINLYTTQSCVQEKLQSCTSSVYTSYRLIKRRCRSTLKVYSWVFHDQLEIITTTDNVGL